MTRKGLTPEQTAAYKMAYAIILHESETNLELLALATGILFKVANAVLGEDHETHELNDLLEIVEVNIRTGFAAKGKMTSEEAHKIAQTFYNASNPDKQN